MIEENNMKIYLKPNWSEQYVYGDKITGYFVGREQEIKSIKSILLNNSSSSILLSSVRGLENHLLFIRFYLNWAIISVLCLLILDTPLLMLILMRGKKKKLILASLIRATHFYIKDRRDKTLDEIYNKCIGNYKEEDIESEKTEDIKKYGIGIEIRNNAKHIIPLFGVFLTAIGISLDILLLRMILGFLGISTIFMFFGWEKRRTDIIESKKSVTIDNSTEYLEIKFEKWLKDKTNKDEKYIFVIDELDKIDEVKMFDIVKEYKNLFTRSFAHFIFISSQKTFDLVNEDREKDAKEGGIFPTFFTHIFYLSLPKTDEIKDYLNQIFTLESKIDENEKIKLINYLLFRSGNDYFELKRLIYDVISFEDKEKPLIDINKLKKEDVHFSGISELFGYVNEWFLNRYLKELKKYWKDNSELQKEIFRFLNVTYNKNIGPEQYEVNRYLSDLVQFLESIGMLAKDGEAGTGGNKYIWTGKYVRSVKAPLLETDKSFNESFAKLIKLANDLDGMPQKYKSNDYKNYDYIDKNRDGQDVSGISLYSIYSEYKVIFDKLKTPEQRITVTTEKTEEAIKNINERMENIFKKYYEILVGNINKILTDKTGIFLNQTLNQRPAILNSCPIIQQTFRTIIHKVYGKNDNTRAVVIVKEYENIDRIREGLKGLNEQKNILIINVSRGSEYGVNLANYEEEYKDKKGKSKKKKIDVDNYINYTVNDFRQFSEILSKIESHLTE